MSKDWIKIGKYDASETIRSKIVKFAHMLKELLEKKQDNYYLIIQSEEKIRSNKQNSWWWGVCITQCYLPYIQLGMDIWVRLTSKKCVIFMLLSKGRYIGIPERTVFTKDDIHYHIINDDDLEIWNPDWDKKIKVFDEKTGQYKYVILRNTRTLNTVQFTELMERAAFRALIKW